MWTGDERRMLRVEFLRRARYSRPASATRIRNFSRAAAAAKRAGEGVIWLAADHFMAFQCTDEVSSRTLGVIVGATYTATEGRLTQATSPL